MGRPPPRHDAGALVADPCPHGRRRVRELLNAVGLRQIYEAGTREDALRLIERAGPGLVVIDWELDREAALMKLARDACKGGGEGRLPVVVTIDQPTRPRIQDILAVGVSNIVVKPFSPRLMRARLERARDAVRA